MPDNLAVRAGAQFIERDHACDGARAARGTRRSVQRSIAYGEGPRRTLDLFRPATAAGDAAVVVFFYGGSWQSGAKRWYRFAGAALARLGYVVVLPDYRIYPEARYPDFLEDGASAVRWARDHAAAFGGNPSKLFVMGHSAGAYIAAMLALDHRCLRTVGLAPDRDIAGLVGIAGPYDFLPLQSETLKVIFGGPDQLDTQPIAHVAPGAPPALLLTGMRDRIVDPGNAARLAARLRAVGTTATVKTYSRVGHLSIVAALARPLRLLAPVLRDVDAFVSGTAATSARRARAVAAP